MNELLTTQSLEGTPLTISATSMPSLDGMGTGAIRSSVFEINNSSSNVNFIAHVWACCSDLFFAETACGPKGRQFDSCESNRLDRSTNSLLSFQNHRVLETKQVSAIDADLKNEVRLKGVPFFNTEDKNPWD